MACSKELRIPKQWSKYHHDIVNEPVDPELFSEDALCAWLEDLGLCKDRSDVAKYVLVAKPYHLVRHQVVLLPNNTLYKKLFKLWVNATIALFISDDFLETLSEIDMRKICNAFQFLADHIGEQVPRFPTIAEMKQFLLLQNVEEKFIPHVIYFLDFANNVGKLIIQQGNTPLQDASNYWRRLVVMISLYYQGVAVEVKHEVGSYSEDIWTRMFSAAALMWICAPEVMSRNVEQTTEIISDLNELYFLGTFLSMVINDIYSYNNEMALEFGVCNLVQTIVRSREVATETEAAMKCVKIRNDVIKVMYQKIEKAKHKNPTNKELWKLLDSIGMASAGWYYWHHHSPRYQNTRWCLTAVDVEEDELKEWRKCTEKKKTEEVAPLLLSCSPTAQMTNDAIIGGVVNMHLYLPE